MFAIPIDLHVAQRQTVDPLEEQRDRMRAMRGFIAEFNVYRWAGRMLMDAAAIRQRRKLGRRSREAVTTA